MAVDYVRELLRQERYSISVHAKGRSLRRDMDDEAVRSCIFGGLIVQEYPSRTPLPRCVIRTAKTSFRPVEVVCDIDYEHDWLTIVTVVRSRQKRSARRRPRRR